MPSETVHEYPQFVVPYNTIHFPYLSKHLHKIYMFQNMHCQNFQKGNYLYICFCKIDKYILFAKCIPLKYCDCTWRQNKSNTVPTRFLNLKEEKKLFLGQRNYIAP